MSSWFFRDRPPHVADHRYASQPRVLGVNGSATLSLELLCGGRATCSGKLTLSLYQS